MAIAKSSLGAFGPTLAPCRHAPTHFSRECRYSSSELAPGAVLVLRQVSVFSPTVRSHYLVRRLTNVCLVVGLWGVKACD